MVALLMLALADIAEDLAAELAAVWDRSLLLRRGTAAAAAPIEQAIMRALAAAARKIDAPGAAAKPDVRFYVENAAVQADLADYLPRDGEDTLETYAERARRKIDGRRFGVVASELEVHSPELWEAVKRILRPIAARVGLHRCSIGAFLGDVATTPFGVHRDPHSTLVFVLSEEKELRVWPESFPAIAAANLKSDYRRFVDGSQLIRAERGDFVYWPRSYFHVGENSGGRARMTLNISFGDRLFARKELLEVCRELSSAGADERRLSLEVELDRGVSIDQVRPLAERLVSPPPPAEELLRAVLARVTALGLSQPALRSAAPLRLEDRVAGDPAFPILLERLGDDDLIAAAGHTFLFTAHAGLRGLIDALSSGRPSSIAELCAPFVAEEEEQGAAIRELLAGLYRAGAIREA